MHEKEVFKRHQLFDGSDLDRPYRDSVLLVQEILNGHTPTMDPRGTNALWWSVNGTINGSNGIFELLIVPETNTVWHFVFKSFH